MSYATLSRYNMNSIELEGNLRLFFCLCRITVQHFIKSESSYLKNKTADFLAALNNIFLEVQFMVQRFCNNTPERRKRERLKCSNILSKIFSCCPYLRTALLVDCVYRLKKSPRFDMFHGTKSVELCCSTGRRIE